MVTFMCQDAYETNVTAAVCYRKGSWEPNPVDVCVEAPGILP